MADETQPEKPQQQQPAAAAAQGRKRDLFAHEIFWAESGAPQRIRGRLRDRAALKDAAARARWDFFHRPDLSEIDRLDAEAMAQLQRRLAARAALIRSALLWILGAALVAGGAGVGFGAQIGAVVFAVLASVVGFFFFARFRRDAAIDEQLDDVEAFRKAMAALAAEHAKTPPTAEAMRAARDAAITRETALAAQSAGADPGAALALIGWSALNEAGAALGPTLRRRSAARAGGLFALTDILVIAPMADRLHLRRSAYDAIADTEYLLEEWELRKETIQIGVAIRRGVAPNDPGGARLADAAEDAEIDAAIAAGAATMREVILATPERGHSLRLADTALLSDLERATGAEIARLETALKAAQARKAKRRAAARPSPAADPAEGATASPNTTLELATLELAPLELAPWELAAEQAQREARIARLKTDQAALTQAIADAADPDLFPALRRLATIGPMDAAAQDGSNTVPHAAPSAAAPETPISGPARDPGASAS